QKVDALETALERGQVRADTLPLLAKLVALDAVGLLEDRLAADGLAAAPRLLLEKGQHFVELPLGLDFHAGHVWQWRFLGKRLSIPPLPCHQFALPVAVFSGESEFVIAPVAEKFHNLPPVVGLEAGAR